MPITKSAKRAQRISKKREIINKKILTKLEYSIRIAKKNKNIKKIKEAMSLVDKAAKKRTIHKNKAARIKNTLSSLLSKK